MYFIFLHILEICIYIYIILVFINAINSLSQAGYLYIGMSQNRGAHMSAPKPFFLMSKSKDWGTLFGDIPIWDLVSSYVITCHPVAPGKQLRTMLYQNNMSMEEVNLAIEREHIQENLDWIGNCKKGIARLITRSTQIN